MLITIFTISIISCAIGVVAGWVAWTERRSSVLRFSDKDARYFIGFDTAYGQDESVAVVLRAGADGLPDEMIDTLKWNRKLKKWESR